MRLLRSLLKAIPSGSLKVKGYGISEMVFKGLTIPANRLQSEYSECDIWLDYWCIPQRDKETQLAAVSSIVDYVAEASMFIVLTGPFTHENGEVRDQRAWFGRGWCRMEQLANALSPTVKPLIIAESTSSVINYGPMGHQGYAGWAYMPVGRGAFTVDADKASLGPVIARLVERRKAQALRENDLVYFRMLHVFEASILSGTGYQVERQPLDAWLRTMRFDSASGDWMTRKHGLTPLYYAVMGCRPDLVARLLEQGADLHTRLRRPTKPMLDHWTMLPSMPILIAAVLASQAHDDASCVRLLLEKGADPRIGMRMFGYRLNVLWWAAGCDCVETCALIMAAAPELADEFFAAGNNYPFECAVFCSRATLPWIIEHHGAKLLQERPPPIYAGRHRIAGQAVYHVGSVETLRMVLDAGADPNGFPEGARPNKALPWIFRVVGYFMRRRALSSRDPSDMADMVGLTDGASPLHIACQRGNMGAVRLLIERGAKLDSTNAPGGTTPLMLAAMRGHTSIVQELLNAAGSTKLGVAALKVAKDKRGKTAMHYARLRGQAGVIELLER